MKNKPDMSLGDYIRSARKSKRLNQKQLADLMNTYHLKNNQTKKKVIQTAISTWESNKTIPPDIHSSALIYSLSLDLDKYDKLRNKTDGSQDTHYLDTYFSTADAYLKKHDYNVDLWFIGPDHLPAFDSNDTIFGIWINNVKRGASYNFVWLLDYVTHDNLHKISTQMLATLKEELPDQQRWFTHYGIALFPNLARTRENMQKYKQICSHFSTSNEIHFHPPRSISESTDSELHASLLKNSNGIFTVLAYCPRSISSEAPRSSVHLPKTRSFDDSLQQNRFFWLDDTVSLSISNLTTKVFNFINSQTTS